MEKSKSKIEDVKLTSCNSNCLNPTTRIINDYYQRAIHNLPEDFYQKIIEYENEIQLSQTPSIDSLRELGALYKKAIEIFSGVSNKKVEFYNNKLTKLIIGANKLNKGKEVKKRSKWSLYMDQHKKNRNKFMLFLTVESNKFKINDLINANEKKIESGTKKMVDDLASQSFKFTERLKQKKIRQKDKINTNIKTIKEVESSKYDNIENNLLDFIKKFHYVYLHNKVFTLYINIYNNILELLTDHKIKKYYFYQEQIKQFELILNDNKNSGNEEQNKDIETCIIDLENERKLYFMELNSMLKDSFDKIKDKLISNNNVEDDSLIKKYLEELMFNVTKLFN